MTLVRLHITSMKDSASSITDPVFMAASAKRLMTHPMGSAAPLPWPVSVKFQVHPARPKLLDLTHRSYTS